MKKVVFLLCLIFCFPEVLSAKLLTHFEFEDSLEDSVGDNNGTLFGSNSATYQAGKNGKILNEDGEFILSAVTEDEANNTFLTISLEADND